MSILDRLSVPSWGPLWLRLPLIVVYLGLFFAFLVFLFPAVKGLQLRKGTDNELLLRLPGISAEGGAVSAIAGVTYGYAAVLSLYGVLTLGGASEASQPAAQTAETPMTDGDAAAASPTPSSATATSTAVPTTTATPSPTTTPTSTPSPKSTAQPATETKGILVTVVEIVDGDTVKIKYQNGTRDTARLLGVDTPEVHGENTLDEFEGVPNNQAGADCLGRWGDEASSYGKSKLLGEQVRITFDENEPRRGYYDRLLVFIHLDGSLFNRQLVSQGYARVYSDSQFTKKSAFLDIEDDAQGNLRGLWECRNVETATPTPTDAQSSGGNVVIETIHYDAAGDEYDNLNDEYVVLTNTGDGAVDIGGWTLSDEAGHTYTVPSGVTLQSGESVTIHTGSGSDSETDLYWGQDAPVWNNGGDTATLRNDDGGKEDSYQYDG